MDPFQNDSGKILEIGNVRLLSSNREDSVRFIETRFSTSSSGKGARLRTALKQAFILLSEIRRPEYKLIVCRSFGRFAWSKNQSWVTNTLRWLMRQFLAFCLHWRSRQAKLVIVDFEDELMIYNRDFRLLEECHLYFKRELAQNSWTNLQRAQPLFGEYQAMMRTPRFRKMASKFRPLCLGISREQLSEIRLERRPCSDDSVEKRYDIFFAGTTQNSTVREEGLRWLQQLKNEGYAVYYPEERLPRRKFMEALSASWLVWSPEGSGWDCYRHYEACLAGSVPVINYPSIRRHAPLRDGFHCFYYAIEGDDLVQKVRAALSDKQRLSEMGQAARKHVLENHTCERLGAYIFEESQKAAETVQIPYQGDDQAAAEEAPPCSAT